MTTAMIPTITQVEVLTELVVVVVVVCDPVDVDVFAPLVFPASLDVLPGPLCVVVVLSKTAAICIVHTSKWSA